MILVKLEDFENHRANLSRYASGLLRTRGFSNHKQGELDALAKDVVQNCYLSFQTSNLISFVTDKHFESFLKLCLYKSYLTEMDYRSRNAQYTLFKKGEFDQLDLSLHPKIEVTADQFDVIKQFKEELTVNQCIIVDKLLEGFTQLEIATELGISKQAINDTVKYIRKKYARCKDI